MIRSLDNYTELMGLEAGRTSTFVRPNAESVELCPFHRIVHKGGSVFIIRSI